MNIPQIDQPPAYCLKLTFDGVDAYEYDMYTEGRRIVGDLRQRNDWV
jgi:hypothetical protein